MMEGKPSMTFDRRITLSVAGNRKSLRWPAQSMTWGELVRKLGTPMRGQENHAEYLRLPKAQQDDLKDVGGFVGGQLKDGLRRNTAVLTRDVVTLDADTIPALAAPDVLKAVAGLGCGYCVYSTRKHEPAAPRLRILLPLAHSVTAEEYEPLARKLAECIGLQYMDPTTFQAVRMMYWPSCSVDSEYLYYTEDKPMIDPDGVLELYQDWRDVTQWPQPPGLPKLQKRMLQKQEDPTQKSGLVGAFCRVYGIREAMDTFLAGVYTPTGENRYTYAAGSTTGGALVYDNKFLFSHHATDPCGDRLVNAFDLVRLHQFAEKDDAAQPGTPVGRLPSYKAMAEFANADDMVRTLLLQERHDEAVAEFADAPAGEEPQAADDRSWMAQLETNTNGNIVQTVNNARLILTNDPKLRGLIAYDRFAVRVMVMRKTPWSSSARDTEGRRPWRDTDSAGLRWYLESVYSLKGKQVIEDAFTTVSTDNAFDDVENYLQGLTWDGTPRIDRLWVEFLGAEDSEYTRAVTRKSLVACVARALDPGVKFDNVLTLVGGQGYGKSTVLEMLGRGWFNASLSSFDRNKEASELIQGSWLIELGELAQLNHSELNAAKQFITRTSDRFRAAYGRFVEDCPRRCVFFGTTNQDDFLRDETGERRFWPLPVKRRMKPEDFERFRGLVDQYWAEAKAYYQMGERLYLDSELLEAAAKMLQERYREDDGTEGTVEDFLQQPVPVDWYGRKIADRRAWLSRRDDFGAGSEEMLIPRPKICAREVWAECYGRDLAYCDRRQIQTINRALARLGWESGRFKFGPGYGQQRGYYRPGVIKEDSDV